MFLEQLYYKNREPNLILAIIAVNTAIIKFKEGNFLHNSALADFHLGHLLAINNQK